MPRQETSPPQVRAPELGTRHYLADRPVDQAPAVVLDVDPGADAGDFADVVLDENDTAAVVRQGGDQIRHRAGLRLVEAGERLVEQQEPG